jgi:hypothetical protein
MFRRFAKGATRLLSRPATELPHKGSDRRTFTRDNQGAGPPFPSSQLRRVPRPCRVFCDRAGILTPYPHHDSHQFSLPRGLAAGSPYGFKSEGWLVQTRLERGVDFGTPSRRALPWTFVEPRSLRTKISHPVNLLIYKDFTDKSFILKDLANHQR